MFKLSVKPIQTIFLLFKITYKSAIIFFNNIDGQLPSDKYTNELEAAVESARLNKNWRRDFMTLEMLYNEKLQEGRNEKAEQIATALLSNGKLSIAEIAECSGLTITQVEALKKLLVDTNTKQPQN